jgi:hypothetical protein
MAGLSNFITNSATQSTTMPSWYDSAQQNIVSRASNAANAMPSLGQTVAGQAVNNLSGANNPFLQSQQTLQQIGSGAANPFFTDPTTGQVTPNTQTAMGGLFQAQNQQLNQLLPNITAAPMASGIGSGQFGSLRGQTAIDKAKADAFANLTAQQMQQALANQQTGVAAGSALGQVGSQGTTSMLNLGQAQQSDPFLAASNLGKIVGGIQAPTTVTNQTQLSPLNQIGSLLGAGIGGYNALNTVSGGALGDLFKNLFSSANSNNTQAAANNLMSNVNMGLVSPSAGGTTYTNLPGIDTSLSQGEVG